MAFAFVRDDVDGSVPLRIDLTTGVISGVALFEVDRGGEKIDLQPREFALLEYLMRHANRAVTKTMILEHIFDYSFDPQTNVVDVLVHRLRSRPAVCDFCFFELTFTRISQQIVRITGAHNASASER